MKKNPSLWNTLKLFTVAGLILLSACASPRQEASSLIQQANWHWESVPTDRFDVATARARERQGSILWVYIEGDGFAYVEPTLPSEDPTPHDPVALKLALAYPATVPAAYVARPCQYLDANHRDCAQRYWTTARYAPEVIDSTNDTIEYLKNQAHATRLILVGYSGGGAVAVLAASQRHDVAAIITVAADLDIGYWTKREKLSPLDGSLDPVIVAQKISSIPQIHFTGGRDDNVGTDVAKSFVSHMPEGSPVRIEEIPDFDHGCCWAANWRRLMTSAEVTSIIPAQ